MTPSTSFATVTRAVVLRPLALFLVAVATYALLPIHQASATVAAVSTLVLSIGLFGWVVGKQARRVWRSPQPTLAAIEAVTLLITMFVLSFSLTYVALSASDPTAFNQSIDKVTGVYFTMTVLSTVGFGDVVAVTSFARMAVVVQMIANLVLLGTVVRFIVGIARRANITSSPSAAAGDA
jgi:hypothetical protein